MGTDMLWECLYEGTRYLQIIVFTAVMMSMTLTMKKEKKIAGIQWGIAGGVVFALGTVIQYVGEQGITRLDQAAYQIESGAIIQVYYSGVTLVNVFQNIVPALLATALVLTIYQGKRSTKIFVSLLFMLAVAATSQFFAEITYIFFSNGDDGYLRNQPAYGIRSLIDFVWLLCIVCIYKGFFRERLRAVLESAEEQIAHIIVIPCLAYVMFEIVKGTLDTYGITLMAVDPGNFLIAVTVIVALLLIYLLIYWSIFRVVTVAASSARVKAELDVASKIQMSALPNKFPAFPDREEIEIYATMYPAKEVGGDFYDFFFVDEEHLAILIADVSGKGVPAALFMMSGRAIIRNQALLGMEPGEILKNANNQLAENNEEGMFITAFLGILNVNTGEFRYSNAGHNVPYICKMDGSIMAVPMKAGFVLAGMKNIRYRTEKIVLQAQEKLILYTDGVTEATDCGMKMYGTERLMEVLKGCKGKVVKQTIEDIVESIEVFVDSAEQADDITILAVERQGEFRA